MPLTIRRFCPNCRRFNCNGGPDWVIMDTTVNLFEKSLEELCQRYGVILSHEDGHGSGIVRFPCRSERPGVDIPIRKP